MDTSSSDEEGDSQPSSPLQFSPPTSPLVGDLSTASDFSPPSSPVKKMKRNIKHPKPVQKPHRVTLLRHSREAESAYENNCGQDTASSSHNNDELNFCDNNECLAIDADGDVDPSTAGNKSDSSSSQPSSDSEHSDSRDSANMHCSSPESGRDPGENNENSSGDNFSDDSTDMIGENSSEDSDNDPLYDGSEMSTREGLLEILMLYVTEKWTKTSLDKSIKLFKKMLPQPNEMPATGNAALAYLSKFTPSLKEIEHSYCTTCFSCTEGVKTCAHPEDEIGKFYTFPIEDQIRYMFEHRGLADIIDSHREKYTNSEGCIADIGDGSFTKNVKQQLPGQYDLVLMGYTDGVNLSKSSKQELWAILCTISEIPPRLRSSFVIVCGVIVGRKENYDMMNMFFKPYVTSLQNLNEKGVSWVHPTSKRMFCSKVVAPILCADAPAKALVLQHVYYNSKYGCNICEQKTKRVELTAEEQEENANQPNPRKRKKRKRRFVFQDDTNPATLRTAERMLEQARKADRTKDSCKGVVGFANVTDIPYFDRAQSVCAEYLHLVLLGVVKYLLNKIFLVRGPWYIGDKISEIDEFIKNIKVPDFVKRMPRGIGEFKFWKASEIRHFLLFYSLPLFDCHLPPEYFQHWILLVASIHLLLQENISDNDLQAADLMIKDFVRDVGKLYGDACYTYNMHTLLHICLLVKRIGPLWATSAFLFESFNGFMSSIIHGTKHLGKELILNIKIAQQVSVLHSIVKSKQNVFSGVTSATGIELLGSPIDAEKLTVEELKALTKAHPHPYVLYLRVKVDGSTLYTSQIYDRNKRRANSFVQFKPLDNSVAGYGKIIVFLSNNNGNVHCLVQNFNIMHVKLFCHEKSSFLVNNLIPVQSSNSFCVIPVRNLSLKLLKIGSYLGRTPNLIEVNL